jgi:tRNA threonylcarbamoyladenosine biosynthesis protein TsaE
VRQAEIRRERYTRGVNVTTVSSAEALESAAENLAHSLEPRQVLILEGVMGAGKTTFTKGLARGFGFVGEVTSPTYNYIHEYPTPQGTLVHIDAYRLEPASKLWQMGLDELLERSQLTVIEWGLDLRSELVHPIIIRLEVVPEGRRITIED